MFVMWFFRDIQAEIDLDGALAQMGSSFVDVMSPTHADEELYAAASHRHMYSNGTQKSDPLQVDFSALS